MAREAAAANVTADLSGRAVDVAWNIESIDAPDDSFYGLICIHLLEHVDARRALSEMRRILTPGGAALVMVPLYEGLDQSYRNPEAAAGPDRDRWLHFHQHDHVQLLGRAVRDLLSATGFEVGEFVATGSAAAKHGLVPGERVFVLR